MWKLYQKSDNGIINGVPKENYLHTLEPIEMMRRCLNLGAKVWCISRMRLKSQNEVTVAKALILSAIHGISSISSI